MKKIVGPIIFVIVAAVLAYFQWGGGKDSVQKETPLQMVTVNIFAGGEKMGLLDDVRFNKILNERYGITLDATKAGSLEMVTEFSVADKDALWPSNQMAVQIFRNRGGTCLAVENIFNSPMVLYAYDIVTDALIRESIVEKKDQSYYVVDFPRLISYIKSGKSWKDIGLPQLYGKIAIHSTDPTRSNSGNMFAGLLANVINGGTVVTEQTLDDVLPKVVEYFQLRGYMEYSSGDIFKNFITMGVGAKPIIIGYENQLVEFILENEKYIDYLREKIRTLYPVPTVWSSHPVIALTGNGKRLVDALKDDEIQKIAWEAHGFRSGLMGVENDPALLKVTGLPKEITSVIPMPDAPIMEKIIASLRAE